MLKTVATIEIIKRQYPFLLLLIWERAKKGRSFNYLITVCLKISKISCCCFVVFFLNIPCKKSCYSSWSWDSMHKLRLKQAYPEKIQVAKATASIKSGMKGFPHYS